MPFQGCTSGLVVSAVVAAVLLVPTRYFVPSHLPEPVFKLPISPDVQPDVLVSSLYDDVPAADVALTASFVAIALIIYLGNWIQRKLMQRRISKLNERLCASVARLRECDERQARLAGSLRAVQAATSEYNLLLYLVLRHHHPAAASTPAPDSQEIDVLDFI